VVRGEKLFGCGAVRRKVKKSRGRAPMTGRSLCGASIYKIPEACIRNQTAGTPPPGFHSFDTGVCDTPPWGLYSGVRQVS
jgi:hypothetical protein